jgi:transposase
VSALWNVANYECRQRFFAKAGVPSYARLCALLVGHDVYRALPSDIAQEVLKKLSEAWSSYFELRKKWSRGALQDKPGLPRYRKDRRSGEYREDLVPIKEDRSYDVAAREVSVVLPRDLRESHGGRIVVPYRGQRRYRGRGGRAEVSYDAGRGRWYFRWAVRWERGPDRPQGKAAGIDLGVRILASVSVEGSAAATHFSGREVLKDWDYHGRQIAKHQQELAHRGRKSSRRLQRLHQRRRARLRHAWEAIAADVALRLMREKVGVVYIGWPKNIRRERSSGALWSGRIHNFWSFELASRILEKHLGRARIRVERVGERGTSSTCPMDEEPAERTHQVVRSPRHLISCKTCGHRIHSDQAGSRNMIRFHKPGIRWDGLEASPRTETLRWQSHRWVDSVNQCARKNALPEAA